MIQEFKSSRLPPMKHEKGILFRPVSQDSLIIRNDQFINGYKFMITFT